MMKKTIYVQFTNGKSETKCFPGDEEWRIRIEMRNWILKNHGRIRKIDGVYLHDRYGNVVGYGEGV